MVEFGFTTEGKDIVAAFSEQVKGKTFLVTGPSTGGIGAEAAISLAAASPSRILLLGRALDKIQPVIDEINSIDASIAAKFIELDLSSMSSVRDAAKAIMEDPELNRIDVMINNGGVMACPYSMTVDGLETQFATNHVGHFLLTNLLMPKILAAGSGARVVNVSSYGNMFSSVRFDDPGFNGGKAYGQGKTANVLMALSLNDKIGRKGGRAYAVHPGSIGTSLQRHLTPEIIKSSIALHAKFGLGRPERKTLQQGCSTTLRAALDPDLAEQGVFLADCQFTTDEKVVAKHSLDKGNAGKCWRLSEEIVGEKFDF